jgi:hypothetical protein
MTWLEMSGNGAAIGTGSTLLQSLPAGMSAGTLEVPVRAGIQPIPMRQSVS